MAYGQVNADVIGTSVSGSNLGAGNASIMKNRIINGNFVIDQRNAGASVTITNTSNSTYVLDRWNVYGSQASKFSVQQNAGSVTPPVGYSKYLGITSLSAYSVLTADYFNLSQYIEGFNIADLGWGTANAKTVTLSFQVYSSLTGTFGGAVNNVSNYSYPFTYSIPVANTWTTISVTIAGPTAGTWTSDNSRGIGISFGLGSGATGYAGTAGSWSANYYLTATGATSVVGTSGATFYITGVQLEVGSSATGFEYVNYQTSLANCQRYYWKNAVTEAFGWFGLGTCTSSTDARIGIALGQTMRTTPTLYAGGATRVYDGGTAVSATSFTINNNSLVYPQLDVVTNSGLTLGRAAFLGSNNNTSTYLAFDAEL